MQSEMQCYTNLMVNLGDKDSGAVVVASEARRDGMPKDVGQERGAHLKSGTESAGQKEGSVYGRSKQCTGYGWPMFETAPPPWWKGAARKESRR